MMLVNMLASLMALSAADIVPLGLASHVNVSEGLPDMRYTKEGNLHVSFENSASAADVGRTFETELFFRVDKANRQVFNMDVCVDFHDTEEENEARKIGSVTICYEGQLTQSEIASPKDVQLGDDAREMANIGTMCNERKGTGTMRGIRLVFNPKDSLYTLYSQVDQQVYRVNASEFVEDEVSVLRFNQTAKYCLRLEMGRLPPLDKDIEEQQEYAQSAVRELIFDSDVKNQTDNVTEVLHSMDGLVMKVEDVVEEFVLKTIDFDAHPDAYAYGSQRGRLSKRLLGLFTNTSDTTPMENRTREQMVSSRLYRDFMPKLKTDKNFMVPSYANLTAFELRFNGIHFLNFTFNGGNIWPCITQWMDLEKFQMERDFYHPLIAEYFAPIQIAYSVGLVGWKNETERGFGPGQAKKGNFGPKDKEEVDNLLKILHKTDGFLSMEDHYKKKFGERVDEAHFQRLRNYIVPLRLNDQKPLSEITVRQLVFNCADRLFNLPYVASFGEGVGL